MNLTLDIGNTCGKMVAFDGAKPIDELHVNHGDWVKLGEFCRRYRFERGIYSSVVNLSTGAESRINSLGFPMMKLVPGITPVPITIKYATPTTLGADRLAAAVGVYKKIPGRDILVIDMGTCITYDLITAKGEYLGGNISPGPTIRLKALNEHTDRLPLVEKKGDTPDVGYSTETAIRSGVMKGIEYEIEGYISDFLLKYPSLYVYLTGGVRLNLHISEKNRTFADGFIVPEGLNHILQYNEELKK